MEPNINGYRIIGELGSGGMSKVYLAEQTSLNRKVVIKRLNNTDSMERLKREGEILARLNHQNIVGVYDYLTVGSESYLIEEFVDGVTLNEILDKYKKCNQSIDQSTIMAIMKQLIIGLDIAHQNKVIHRDLKPENVIVNNNSTVKILDFGISSITGEISTMSREVMRGTVEYMPPELFDDNPTISEEIDYYAVGCILYELMTLSSPFSFGTSPSLMSVIKAKLSEFRPPAEVPHWGQDNLPIIDGLLSSDPTKRKTAYSNLTQKIVVSSEESIKVKNDRFLLDVTKSLLDDKLKKFVQHEVDNKELENEVRRPISDNRKSQTLGQEIYHDAKKTASTAVRLLFWIGLVGALIFVIIYGGYELVNWQKSQLTVSNLIGSWQYNSKILDKKNNRYIPITLIVLTFENDGTYVNRYDKNKNGNFSDDEVYENTYEVINASQIRMKETLQTFEIKNNYGRPILIWKLEDQNGNKTILEFKKVKQ